MTDEASPEPGPDAETDTDAEIVRGLVLPVVNEVQQYIEQQRKARAELERALDGGRALREEIERQARASRELREEIERHDAAARKLRAEIEAASQQAREWQRAASTVDAEIRHTFAAMNAGVNISDLRITFVGRGAVGSPISLSQLAGLSGLAAINTAYGGVRLPKMQILGSGTVTSTFANAGVATATASVPDPAVKIINLASTDETNVGAEVEKVTAEVNRHGLSSLTPSQIIIAVVVALVIGGLRTAEALGPKGITVQIDDIGRLTGYAAAIAAIILIYQRKDK